MPRQIASLNDLTTSQPLQSRRRSLFVREKRSYPLASKTASVSSFEEADRPQSPEQKRERTKASAGQNSASRGAGTVTVAQDVVNASEEGQSGRSAARDANIFPPTSALCGNQEDVRKASADGQIG